MKEPICPYIRRAWYDVMRPNNYIKERVIFDYELLYIKEGTAWITVEDKCYQGQVGDVFLFRPRQRHSIHVVADHSFVQPHVHFDLLYRENREQIPISFQNLDEIAIEEYPLFHKDILDSIYSPFPSMFHLHSPHDFELKLFDLIHEFENPSIYASIRFTSLFMTLWEQVLNEVTYNFDTSNTQKDASAQKIKYYIEQNTHTQLSMDELSELTHFSKSYVNRLFREAYHIPPLRYHMYLRMQKAKSLIRNTNMTISEISELLGFTTVQYFSFMFKNSEGLTPSKYRATEL